MVAGNYNQRIVIEMVCLQEINILAQILIHIMYIRQIHFQFIGVRFRKRNGIFLEHLLVRRVRRRSEDHREERLLARFVDACRILEEQLVIQPTVITFLQRIFLSRIESVKSIPYTYPVLPPHFRRRRNHHPALCFRILSFQ